MLIDLVTAGVESARDAVGKGVLAGDVALGLLFVGFLAGLGGVALDGFRDVVRCVLRRNGLANCFALISL